MERTELLKLGAFCVQRMSLRGDKPDSYRGTILGC